MGFQNSGPKYNDVDLLLQSLNMWTQRADAAMITTEVPWAALIAGTDPKQYVIDNYKSLVEHYRSLNFKLWVYIDPANGLDRAKDAQELIDAGKSIADPDMQAQYQRFVVVMDSILKPEHLGLALETNMIRAVSPPSIYNGVKQAAQGVAAQLKSKGSSARLSVSIQADKAWGVSSSNPAGTLAADFDDFPFAQEMGISSYPYFSFAKPADIPADYFSKLFEGRNIPVFVSEGGWTSKTIPSPSGVALNGSLQIQQDYIARQTQLLDNVKAIGLFSLTFTDIDLTSLPSSVNPSIQYFAYLGMVDKDLKVKPALNKWDEMFKRKLAIP